MSGGTDKAAGLAWIAAERAAGRQPDNARVRQRWAVSERTARNWLRSASGNGSRPAPATPPATPPATITAATGNGSTPEPATSATERPATAAGKRRPDRQTRQNATPAAGSRQQRQCRIVMAVTGVGIAAVLAAPVAISARSLAGWGRQSLGLAGGWEWLVPLPLDGAALACVGLALHATLRGDAPGLARILVWVLAGGSAWANWRHGITISPDAAAFFAVQPLLGALLLDLVMRRVRHVALGGLGALEAPLARYRVARWLVAPRETWRAWRTAVREGITDPDEALARAAAKRACPSVPVSKGVADAGDSAGTRPSEEAT